jgi:acyl dehydratase
MIQTAAGAGRFPSEVADSLIGMIEATGRFLLPVYRGNTLYPLLEITDLTEQTTTGVITMRATIHNQEDSLVFEGTQRYLIRKRPI